MNGAVNGVSAKRKGKKRGRGYEGDELFKGSREVIFSNKSDGEAVLAACDGKSHVAPLQPLNLN